MTHRQVPSAWRRAISAVTQPSSRRVEVSATVADPECRLVLAQRQSQSRPDEVDERPADGLTADDHRLARHRHHRPWLVQRHETVDVASVTRRGEWR